MSETDQMIGDPRMLIDGRLTEARSGARFDVTNPATEEKIGEVADARAQDMDLAIGSARRAFDETSWSTDHMFRQRCLRQLHEAIVAEKELFRAELVAESGCPVAITYGPQLDAPLADGLLWPAEALGSFQWERDLAEGNAFGMRSWRKVLKEPAGVVGAIVPWNYPFEITIQKLGQALATGNTVVLKPAPDTPLGATRIGRLIAEQTDIPAGVVNVVTPSDNAVAEGLVRDRRVDLISFTGSTAVGRRIMAEGSASMKRLFLELGGKSAHIVLDDADLAATVPGAAFVCVHAGQGCAMMTRLLVPRSRYDEAIELLEGAFGQISFGDPTDLSNLQGPQISERQRTRVLDYIGRGVADGARVVLGGGRPAHLPKGWYVEPTLLADVTNDMAVAREEIFGPVLVVIAHDGDEDAIRLANDSEYGLSGMVSSGSEERAVSVARRIRSGTVGVNGGIFYGADAPFGGYKASGFGRQNGLEGFEQYLETKTLSGPAGVAAEGGLFAT